MANVLAKSSDEYNLDVSHFSIGSHWLYDEDSRLDATTYASGAFFALDAIEACRYPKESIGEQCGTIWHPVQNQARSNFKRIYTKPEHGVPFVSSKDMFFLPLRPERFLSRRMPKLGDLMVPEGWLLLSRSGTVGNVLYVNRTLARCAITDHAIRIQPTNIPSGYLYAFLSSSYGQPIIAKGTYGSTVDEIEPKHLASIPIPKPPESVQHSIHDKIIQAYTLRDEANDQLSSAEHYLYELLGVSPFSEEDIEYFGNADDPRAFIVSTNDLNDRFDASNHVPIVQSAIHKLEKGSFPLVQLAEKCATVFIPARFKRNYVVSDKGVPYLLPSQIPTMRPYEMKGLSRSQAKECPEYLLTEGQVLLTTDGTIGRVHPVTKRMVGWFGSNNMARLWDEKTDMGFLYAYLATPYGKHQVCKEIYGGVIDHINEKHINAVLVPDVPKDYQIEIGDLVRSAFTKKDRANELEDLAIAEMESVIMNKHEQPLKLVKKPEEPQSEADRFRDFVKKVVSVPKEEIDRRQAEYEAKKQEKKSENK